MLTPVKQFLKGMPLLGPTLRRVAGVVKGRPAFTTAAEYWEERYRAGGNSGAGSYNRLAQFKADVLNDLVRRAAIASVIELGCGDGAQLELARYPRYVGVDVSTRAVAMCRERYRGDASKAFFTTDTLPAGTVAEAALSLDVIYHLVEDATFERYMRSLFDAATRYVVIYSSNDERPWPSPHVRHRRFTTWIERQRPGWALEQLVRYAYPYDPHDEANTSFADFHVFRRV